MKQFFKIPALTCSLLFVLVQPSFAQSGGTGTGAGTSVGNHTDHSGGMTTNNSRGESRKIARRSSDCAANEAYVKQGGPHGCIPRTPADTQSTGSGQNQDKNRSGTSGTGDNP